MQKTRLDRDVWLQRSLDVLRVEGIQGVRVERLARDLGVTKGSFYWHFKDRDDLLQSILDFWTDRFNNVILENRELLEPEPGKGLLAAIRRVREEGLDRYELAMRAWADHDSDANATVSAIYEKRSAFIRGFFKRLGFGGLDAEVRTRLTLCYLSWEPNMYPDDSAARRLKLLELQCEILTKK